MAYIGNIPAEQFTSVDIQNFSVSATANYTLDRPVANENEIELFINNVRQHPGSGKAYTASGTTLTLSEATAGSDTMYCVYQGKARQTVTPATSSVTNAMLAGSIADAKISAMAASKLTGTVAQANIADQAINEAKMQVSNSPVNGYMLTAQSGNTGGLTWAEAGSGGLVYLGGSESSSSASAVTFDNVFSSTYRAYKVIGMFAPSQDTWFKWRYRSGGSDVNANTYTNVARTTYNDNTDSFAQYNWGANQRTYGQFATADVDSDANSSYVVIDWTFYDPNTDVFSRSQMTGLQTFRNGGNGKLYVGYMGQGQHSNTNNDGVKFETNAGTISYHSVRIYGIVNS
mgnify:FL=1